MEVHGLPYKNMGDGRWREVEWTRHALGPLPRSLDLDSQQQLAAVVLADFPTQQQILDWAAGRFPTVAWQLSQSHSRFFANGVRSRSRRKPTYHDFPAEVLLSLTSREMPLAED